MEVTSALLRTGLRAFNRLGEGLERAGVELVSLDERRLLDAACRETGIPSFADEGFREPPASSPSGRSGTRGGSRSSGGSRRVRTSRVCWQPGCGSRRTGSGTPASPTR